MKHFVWAAVTLAALFFSGGAFACNVPNPNLNAPPFVDGCAVPASALNNLVSASALNGAIGIPVSQYGALSNGAHDDGPAINACLAANSVCIIPTSTLGTYVATAVQVPDNENLVGYGWSMPNPPTSAPTFAGSSWILCSNSVTKCVSVGNNDLKSGTLRNLVISGVAGAPTVGTVGVYVNGGYNITLDHIGVFNRDSCVYYHANSATSAGISSQMDNPYLGACQTNYLTMDGWPELKVIGGRFGMNGTGDYPGNAFIYVTDTNCTTGGCGPNTLSLFGTQFNSGSQALAPAHWLDFANFVNGIVDQPEEFKADSIHVENLATGGSMIASDSSISAIGKLQLVNSSFTQDSSTANFFGIASGVELLNSTLTGNVIDNLPIAMQQSPASGPGLRQVQFIGNKIQSNVQFTTPLVGLDVLTLVGNTITGTLTYASASASDTWAALTSIGNTAEGGETTTSAYGNLQFLDGGSENQNAIRLANPPATAPTIQATGAISVANSAHVLLATQSGVIIVDDTSTGQVGSYICGGGACSLLGSPGSEWAASSTTPSSGDASVANTGSGYAVYNNTGATIPVNVGSFSVRTSN